jgi:uncharacterized protein (TIGR02453 family)
MSFTGFGPQTLPFFKALAFHQTKEWFDENKALYEQEIKTPLGDLVETLSEKFAAEKIPLKGTRKGSIFRINRDVRFSKSKDLYKTNCSAVLSRTGTKQEQGLLYLHFDPKGCFAAGGFWMPEPTELGRMRRAIVRDPAAYARVVARLEKAGLAYRDDPKLTRLPKGFEDVTDTTVMDAIKQKSFTVSRPLANGLIGSPALVEPIVALTRDLLPLLDWGWAALVDER